MNRLLAILCLCLALPAFAWNWWPLPISNDSLTSNSEAVHYFGEFSLLTSTGDQAPTPLYTNTNGNISSLPHSLNLSLGVIKPATRPTRWFDYDGAVVLTARAQFPQQYAYSTPDQNASVTGYFRELYAHARLYIIDITAGIHSFYIGAGDSQLTSGSLLISNNAHPIPRISIGIDNWTAFPGLFGYFEFKGGISHGWLNDNNSFVKGTLFHHKFVGGRLGGKLPVNISYEFHHVAQWGGYSSRYGDLGNDFAAFMNAFLEREGGTSSNEKLNAQGNHIGFQQLALDVKGDGWKVTAYWQYINEDGPTKIIGFGMNNKDGLWGVNVTQTRWPYISGFTYEYLHTTDQSGPFHDRDGCVYGGNDNYFNNSIYRQGWTYYGNIIGSPFLSLDNNRVSAHFAGVRGDIFGFRYRVIESIATYYGTYNNPSRTTNTTLLLEVRKRVPKAWDLEFGFAFSSDFGTRFGTSYGCLFTITKQGLIKSY